MRYLGIDYGKSKIGTAYSEGEIASVGEVLPILGLADALKKVSQILNKENIKIVVIGKPESGKSLELEQKFVASLKFKHPDLSIVETGEILTSKRSQDLMLQLNIAKTRRRVDDSYAAALILQDYLDEKNSS